jgi:hypothetical protein
MRTAIKTSFTLLDSKSFIGYTFGDLWNGWACPLFPIESVFQVAEYLNNESDIHININSDCIEITDNDYKETVYPQIILNDNKEIVVYPIGYYSYCWEDTSWNTLN